MTPRVQRLGLTSPAPQGPPPQALATARGFLLDHIAVRTTPKGFQLVAPLAGGSEGLTFRWVAHGASIEPQGVPDLSALLVPERLSWSASVTLLRGDQVIDTVSTRPPVAGPVAASTADGAKLRWTASLAPPEVTIDGAPAVCDPTDLYECVVSAPRGTVLRFGAGSVTAGAAPDPEGVGLEEHPDECADDIFPAPLAGGMVGCSTPDVLDRHRSAPGSPRRRLKGLPRLTSHRTGLSSGSRQLLVAEARQLGSWSPLGSSLASSRMLTVSGRPAGDQDWLLIPLSDRMQAGQAGSNRRSQLHARPVPNSTIVAGGWATWIERGSKATALTDLARNTTGTWPTPAARRTMLRSGWLLIATPNEMNSWGLQGQPGWSLELDTTFTSGGSWQDDIIALPVRDDETISTVLIHAPTGLEIDRLGTREEWSVPRGADANGLVVHARQPGARGVLRRHATPLRILEEDGALGLHSNAAGGHGGRQLMLSAGESVETSVYCHHPSVLRAFRSDDSGEGTIVVTVAGKEQAIRPAGVGWVDVTPLPRETDVDVRFLADAAGGGFTVDALMLEARP